MAFDSVLFEDCEVIIWLGQTLNFGWVITIDKRRYKIRLDFAA